MLGELELVSPWRAWLTCPPARWPTLLLLLPAPRSASGGLAAQQKTRAESFSSSSHYILSSCPPRFPVTPSLPSAQQVPGENVVGQPHRHMAADQQVTGEAQYVDDIPMPRDCLHAAFVMSTKPHARILNIDTSKAEAMPGVAGVFTAKDIPGLNSIGAVMHDEELLASVGCAGGLRPALRVGGGARGLAGLGGGGGRAPWWREGWCTARSCWRASIGGCAEGCARPPACLPSPALCP